MASTSPDLLKLREKIARAARNGDSKIALSLAQRLLKLPQASVRDCLAMAQMSEQFVDAQTSVSAMRAAHKRAPQDLNLLFKLVTTELRSGYTREALKRMERAAKLCQMPDEFDDLGNHYSRLGEAKLAYDAFAKAHAMAPDNLQILSNTAVALGFLGRIDEAEALFDLAITKGNRAELTFLNRSWLRKQTAQRNHIPELRKALEDLTGGQAEAPYLLYALAKEHEDVGLNDEAFAFLERGAAARRKQVDYSLKQDQRNFNAIINTYNGSVFEDAVEGCSSDEPVFVLGMPRSGTTLVERIIGSHSNVFAAGELQNFNRMVKIKTAEAARATGQPDFDPLAMSLRIHMKELGKSYIASTRPRTGHTSRFIDKQTTNFIFCGLIAMALPNAKFVHMWRNPMDTCYAIFKQPFLEGYDFRYEQRELAGYYLAYLKLMAHWDKVLPGRIIHVQYEELVSDTETVVRDLLQRLGLKWEDACLDHTANPDASMTASATQVRQPIYASSVGRWRRFERQLAPLKEVLEAGGVRVD